MAKIVKSILQVWTGTAWETVYASAAKPTSTATAINNGSGFNATATSLTVDSTTGILAGDYLKIVNADDSTEIIQVRTVASGTVLNPVLRGQIAGTTGGATPAAITLNDNAVVTKMSLGAAAVVKVEIEEKLGSPVMCTINLFNKPYGAGRSKGYVQDQYASKLEDFGRIRVLDDHSKAILFFGRVYRKSIEYDQRYGSIMRITAFDALKELADNRLQGDSANFTGKAKRSIIISDIVKLATFQNAAGENINLSTADTQKFVASVSAIETDVEYDFSKGKHTGLSAVAKVAGMDAHTAGQADDAPSVEHGYTYFVDNGFTSSLNTTSYTSAIPTLNYFQRGSIPDSTIDADDFYKITYGSAESDGVSGNSYASTVNALGSFQISKQFTDIATAINVTYKDIDKSVNTITCYRANVSGVAGTNSGAFHYETLFGDKGSISIENSPTISIDSSTSSYTKTPVGRLIHIDALSGDNKNIVFTLNDGIVPEDIHESVLTAASKTSDFIRVDVEGGNTGSAGDPASTGANRFTVNSTSDVDAELLRTIPQSFDITSDTTNVREAIAEMFIANQTTTRPSRAEVSILDYPFHRLTVDPSSRSGNVLSLPVDIYKHGARKGMVVRQLKSGVETGNYGYISAIVTGGSPTVTVVLSNAAGTQVAGTNLPWADTDTFDVYIPIRPGFQTYLTNAPAGITADSLVTASDFIEGMGVQSTSLSSITDNFAALTESSPGVSAGDASATPLVPDSKKRVYYDVTAGATTAMLSLPGDDDDYREVLWAAGTLTVGLKRYSIAGGNTTAALDSAYLANNQWYVIYFLKSESITTFKVASFANLPKDEDLIRIAQVKASASTSGDAVWRFDSSDIILSAEAGATVDASNISDGALGTSKFVRGGQPFTLVNSVDSTVNMWSSGAYNAVAWTAATLKYSDGDTLTVNAGSSTGLAANKTYWAYVTTTNGNIATTLTAADAVGDTKILVALIRVGADTEPAASIAPLGSQAPVLSTSGLAANAIISSTIASTALDAHTITLATGGKLVTAAGLGRDGTNQWTTMAGGGTGGGVLIDTTGIIGTSKSDDGDINDTEFYMAAADGKLYAGGGAVIIDAAGLTIKDDSSDFSNARFKLQDGTLSTLEFYCQGTPSHNYIVSTTQTSDSGSGYDTDYAHNLVIGASNVGKLAKILPSANIKVSLGGASKRFLEGYFQDIKLGTNELTLGLNSTDLAFNGKHVLKMDNTIAADSEYWAFEVADSSSAHRKFMYPSNVTQDGTPGDSYSYIGSHDDSGTWTSRPLTAVQSYYMWAGDGAAAGPAFSFTSDSNTGFYRIASGQVGYSSDGTNEFYFDTGIYPATDSSGGSAGESLGAGSQAWHAIHGYTLYLYNSAATTGTDLIVTSGGQIAKKSSSIQYKDNVKELVYDSSKLDKLRPVSYDYKLDNAPDIGLIAEEVDEIYPELINYDKHGKAESIKYHGLSVMLLEEMKNLRKEIKELKEKS